MVEIPEIVLPHGGYRKLIAYRKSEVIYQGTVVFCRRFLPAHGDRTVDQMVQAARSGKQNIAEGSSASGTSRETEIKLTNVARASLDELLEDYLDWLKAHGEEEWAREDSRKVAAKDFAKEHPDWEDWKGIFESRPAETLCNLQIVLIHQTRYLLERMIQRQEVDFKQNGGVRERMHAARVAARGGNWAAGLRDWLGAARVARSLRGGWRRRGGRLNGLPGAFGGRKGGDSEAGTTGTPETPGTTPRPCGLCCPCGLCEKK